MNHNPQHLAPGDMAILDKGLSTESKVIINGITKHSHAFSRVHSAEIQEPSDSDCWEVMTNRLTLYKRKKEIIKVDFDGTVVVEAWPEIGEPLPLALEVLRELCEHGHYLILWTCREGENLQAAIDFCKSHGITFGAINENHPENPFRDLPGAPSRKPYAHRHIDDKNFGDFPGWHVIRSFYFGDASEPSEAAN